MRARPAEPPLQAHECRCDACGTRFTKARPDAEAAAEFAELFPADDLAHASVVCDPCFKRMQAAGLFDEPAP